MKNLKNIASATNGKLSKHTTFTTFTTFNFIVFLLCFCCFVSLCFFSISNFSSANISNLHFSSLQAPKTAFAEAQGTYYARIESSSSQLYSAPSELASLCILPHSYYVVLDGTKSGNYYAVTYNGAHGYVKSSDVTIVEGIPEHPFYCPTLVTWSNTKLHPTAAENASSSQQNATADVASGTALTYIGQKVGSTVHDNSNLWYYVSLPSGQVGYVFSEICNNLPETITPCPDNLPALNADIFSESTIQEFSGLSTSTKILLIVAIAVPSALIIYFLVKPSKLAKIANGKTKKSATTARKSRKIHRHGDYFEFDENEL